MWPIDRPPRWVDRTQELATLRAGIEALRHGGSAAVWVEGEPGIGKSSLVAEALEGASELGWDIGWGIADQLAERLPLSVIQDCLQVRLSSPDPRRAHAASLLRSQRLGLFADGDASVSGVEVLMALADELCATAPTVIVIDDLQWADDTSLLVWHQLAASIDQLRLLLIATCRSDQRRPEVQQVQASLTRRGGAVVTLGPLPEADVAALVTGLLGSMPTALRTALHAEAAQELAATDADALSVAQQLFAARQPGEGWARAWLIQTAPTLTTRAPQLAADLLRRELDETPSGEEARDALMASLARALLAVGSHDEAARQARAALSVMTDLVRRAETYSVLARAQVSAGHSDEAIATMRQALASAGLPRTWQARMLALLAMLERADTGDLDTADETARRALAVAEAAGDAFATAHALTDLWLSHSVRRGHAAALDYVDQALRVLGEDPGYADLRSFAVDGRIFTLQNLDRWPEAELTLQQARESAQRSGSPDRTTWVTAAVLRYWLGQWDDALAELSSDEDRSGRARSERRGPGRAERDRRLVRGPECPLGHPPGRQPAPSLWHQARRPRSARAAGRLRLGRAHPGRGQDRCPGRPG